MMGRAWGMSAVAILLLGCAGKSTTEGASGAGGSGNASGTGGAGNAAGAGAASAYVGTWVGYVESYESGSGLDQLAVVIDSPQPSGGVTFGTSAPPPPPTNPDVGYPPGIDDKANINRPVDGFVYGLRDGSATGTRLQFKVHMGEVWTEWCALQEPALDPATGQAFGCLPNYGTEWGSNGCFLNDPSAQKIPVDCGKLFLCSMAQVCTCTKAACAVGEVAVVSFDVKFGETEADGSVDGLSGGRHNVHLIKQ